MVRAILLSLAICAGAEAAMCVKAEAQTLPAGWVAADVGGPAIRGAASATGAAFSVSGAGADVWGTADQFMFVHRTLTGDGAIVARVATLTNSDPWTKAGVMIRESLAAGSRHAFALASVGKGIAFQRRPATGGESVHTGVAGGAGTWVRLQRSGSTITASRSPDGVAWTTIGTQTLVLPATVYVGLAVTSHNASALATATLADVAVSAPITKPWTSSDVGAGVLPGSWVTASGVHTVEGAGKDIWDSADAFRFTYQQVTGDVDILARVSAIEKVDPWTKAGVMVRSSLSAGSAHAHVFVSAAKGVAFQRRPADNGASLHTAASSAAAPSWVKLTRRGAVVTALHSQDGTTWKTVGTQVLTLPPSFYVGLAVTSHNASVLATATFDNVAVEDRSLAANQWPTVTLGSPAAGARFRTSHAITLAASAGDPDGTVQSVAFYADSTLVGIDTSSPYSVSWNAPTARTYDVTAVARDNDGAVTVSGAHRIEVVDSETHLLFAPSGDDDIVLRYVVEYFPAAADPRVANPVATWDVGKPPVVNGRCEVDVTRVEAALPPGIYIATVSAIGEFGQARSEASAQFAR